MKVMIVDDSPAMRSLIRDIVAPVADEVVECSDGDQAVDCYACERPDWTVMDYRMAHLSGLEATRALRARWPLCRVLLISELGGPDLPAAAREAGAAGYLSKDHLASRLVPLLTAPPPPSPG